MNTTILLGLNLLRVIAAQLQATGVISADVAKYGGLIDLVANLMQRGDEAKAELELLLGQVQTMQTEGRGPTEEERASWRDRSDAAHAALQNLKSTD